MASRTVSVVELAEILSKTNPDRLRKCCSWISTRAKNNNLLGLEIVQIKTPPGVGGKPVRNYIEITDEQIEELTREWLSVKVRPPFKKGKNRLSVIFKSSEEYSDPTKLGDALKPRPKPVEPEPEPQVEVKQPLADISGPGKVFRVELFDLATFLIAKGHRLVRVEANHHRMPFCFEVTPELMQDQFNYQMGDDMVSAHEFYMADKLVRHIRYNKITGVIDHEKIREDVDSMRRTWGPQGRVWRS